VKTCGFYRRYATVTEMIDVSRQPVGEDRLRGVVRRADG